MGPTNMNQQMKVNKSALPGIRQFIQLQLQDGATDEEIIDMLTEAWIATLVPLDVFTKELANERKVLNEDK